MTTDKFMNEMSSLKRWYSFSENRQNFYFSALIIHVLNFNQINNNNTLDFIAL